MKKALIGITFYICLLSLYAGCSSGHGGQGTGDQVKDNVLLMIDQGRQTFRFDTFGDESFWGDALKLHQAIEGSKFEGVGAGVSPKTALSVGLKVDVDALPQDIIDS